MKRFKKLLAMSLTAISVVSAISINAFAVANHDAKTVDPNVQIVAIDENGNERIIPLFYDENAADRSEQRSKQRVGYSVWDWSQGNYTEGINWSSSLYDIPYVFRPTYGELGINSTMYGINYIIATPCVAINDYTIEQGGQNGYVGSFNYDSLGGGTYEIDYVVRGLTQTHNFLVTILGNGNWSNGYISIQR